MENKVFYPTCKFCKQQTLPTAAYQTQEAADEAATISCKCGKSKEYQQELERAAERDKNIAKLTQSIDDFASYCYKRGVELTPPLHDILLTAGVSVLDGVLGSANFKFNRIKVNISTNSKSNVVIGFSYSDGAKVEV